MKSFSRTSFGYFQKLISATNYITYFINRIMKEEEIIKKEKVGYLQSKLNLMQGTLYLTSTKLILEAHKTGVGGLGILGAILKRKVESKIFGFNLNFKEIKSVSQGKHGAQKNVLEITNDLEERYRIIVKNYTDWENELTGKV